MIFGKDVVNQLPEVMSAIGKRVLLAYGGGSIKRMGLYDKVKELMKDFEVYELSGIEPNPRYNPSVLDGVRICKEKNIEVILAVGGGSVLDCTKAIAAGALYDIITLAATGSEYDCASVISRTETNDKVGYLDPHIYPVCSFMDPTYTFTVNAKHTAAGVADAFNHVLEQYFSRPNNTVSDGFCETLMKTLIKFAPIAIAKPDDYDARAEIMYAATFGCNGLLALGTTHSGWPMHGIEHALSAYYDITHGEGLAIITPRWMRHILSENTIDRFVSYGTNVFGISAELTPAEIAEQAIQKTYDFFLSLNIPMTLHEVGIDDSRLEEMAHHIAVNEGLDKASNFVPLTEGDILSILKASL